MSYEIVKGLLPGLDSYVYMDVEQHRYFDRDQREYESVSKFISRFVKPFDVQKMAPLTAKKRGVSVKTVLDEWNLTRDNAINHGNRIHDALERFDKTTTITPENDDLRPTILAVSGVYKSYYRRVSEALIYDTQHFIAGTTDKIMQCTSHPNSVIDLDDYKTNLSKGIEYKSKYNEYMLGPLSHLQNCSYNKYALQLSIYAYLYQKKTGCKIGMLNIMFIPPHDHLSFRRIALPYMKLEVEAMLEYKKVVDSPKTVAIPSGFSMIDDEDF